MLADTHRYRDRSRSLASAAPFAAALWFIVGCGGQGRSPGDAEEAESAAPASPAGASGASASATTEGASTPDSGTSGTSDGEASGNPGARADAAAAALQARLQHGITADGVLVIAGVGSVPTGAMILIENLATGAVAEARGLADGSFSVLVPGGNNDPLGVTVSLGDMDVTLQLRSVVEAEAALRGPCNCGSVTFHPEAAQIATVHSPLECWCGVPGKPPCTPMAATVSAQCAEPVASDVLRQEGCDMVAIARSGGYLTDLTHTFDPATGEVIGVVYSYDTGYGICALGIGSAWSASRYAYGRALIVDETCSDVTQCVLCGPGTSGYPPCSPS